MQVTIYIKQRTESKSTVNNQQRNFRWRVTIVLSISYQKWSKQFNFFLYFYFVSVFIWWHIPLPLGKVTDSGVIWLPSSHSTSGSSAVRWDCLQTNKQTIPNSLDIEWNCNWRKWIWSSDQSFQYWKHIHQFCLPTPLTHWHPQSPSHPTLQPPRHSPIQSPIYWSTHSLGCLFIHHSLSTLYHIATNTYALYPLIQKHSLTCSLMHSLLYFLPILLTHPPIPTHSNPCQPLHLVMFRHDGHFSIHIHTKRDRVEDQR